MSRLRSFLLLMALLSLGSSAFAGVRVVKVVAGLDGYLRGDRWIPVVFQLQGSGSFQGSVEVARGETVFRKSLDLNGAGTRRMEILVYVSNYYEALTYRILDISGRIVSKDNIDIRMLNYQDNMVLVVSSTDYNHQFLNGIQNPWGGKTFVAYLKPEELFIDPIAYSTADAIALGNLSLPELPAAQRKALLMYAATGGTMVFSAATSFSVLQDPSLSSVMPAISPELNLLSHGEFLVSRWTAKTTGVEFPAFTMPIQEVRARPSDNILVTHTPELSLVTSSSFYKGNIIYFAFDYTRMPEQIAQIFPGYWNDLVHPTASGAPAFGMPMRQRLEDNPRAQVFLYNIPGLKLPDVKWFALFFFIYLIAIGPLQYFLLTRSRKNALLWTTFPLIILVFTGAALGYSKFRRNTSQSIRQIQVLDAFPSLGMQCRYQGFGTASSESGSFTYQALPENSYMTKSARQSFTGQFEPFTLSEDLPHSIVGENVKTWTYRTFDAISTEPLDLPVKVNAQIDGATLYGTITNSGPDTLENSFFVYDSKNAANIGAVQPGATAKFSVELNNSSPPPFAESHLRGILNIRSLSLNNPHFYFAEIHDRPGEIVINGKGRATQCLKYMALYTNFSQSGPANVWRSEYTPEGIFPMRPTK